MKPVEKKHPTWSRQGWKNYIGHNVPDDKIRKLTEGPYIIQTWPNERFWYILKFLSIENAKWKLTFRNVSISNPPLSSRKSFPHFYFTPNYPEGPPSLILQHLTPLSHCSTANNEDQQKDKYKDKDTQTQTKRAALFHPPTFNPIFTLPTASSRNWQIIRYICHSFNFSDYT